MLSKTGSDLSNASSLLWEVLENFKYIEGNLKILETFIIEAQNKNEDQELCFFILEESLSDLTVELYALISEVKEARNFLQNGDNH